MDRPPHLIKRRVFAHYLPPLQRFPLDIAGVNLDGRYECMHGGVEPVVRLGMQVPAGEDVERYREAAQHQGQGSQKEHREAVRDAHVASDSGEVGSPSR